MEFYVVKPGDSVDSISRETGISPEQIIYDNQLLYPYKLAVGQALLIHSYVREAVRAILVSGYAYPYINSQVLADTLPYLSELPIFSYGFTMEGELLPPPYGDDQWMITEALEFGTLPVLTLTPFGPDGNFNNQLIHSVVNNPSYRERLFQNLLETMDEKGYQGLDIDFEYILPEDRDAFSAFVEQAAQTMRSAGYRTSIALAPKTSPDQKGLLYEGKDYRALGAAADHVLLMTYEWGYTYGPPMAVAPVNQVRRVVEYALTEIPPEKIILGIPNYGYDWPLPYVRGTTRAQSLGTLEAVQSAIDHGVDIRFDETAMSPYFRYWQYGIQHEVWFEDVRSLRAKFGLVKEYGLAGAGYWQLMRFFRANWLLLNELFVVEKP